MLVQSGRALAARYRSNEVCHDRRRCGYSPERLKGIPATRSIVADKTDSSNTARFRVLDLGSTNGTLVNGQVIREAVLNDGDKILIGDHLFRFEMLDEIDQSLATDPSPHRAR